MTIQQFAGCVTVLAVAGAAMWLAPLNPWVVAGGIVAIVSVFWRAWLWEQQARQIVYK